MNKKTRSKSPPKTKTQIEKYIILPDLHVPEHDAESLNVVNQFIYENAPWAGIIYLGDVLDMGCISSHNAGLLRRVEGQRLLEDYKICDEEILKPHEKIINPNAKRYWIQGNHKWRVERWLDANPSATGLVEPEIILKLKQRNIEWMPYWSKGSVLKIGKALFIHGRWTCEHHAKKHAIAYAGHNVFYGHTHSIQSYCLEQYGETTIAQSLGCLCKPQEWMQGKPDKWQQAIAVFEFMPDGEFGYSVIRIKNHRFVFGGKRYGGN
jgi:hypothetical protein